MLYGIVRFPSGLIAVGQATVGAANDDALVLVSHDGVQWDRIEHPALGGEGRQAMTAVAAGPRGIVAVGFDSIRGPTPEDAALWASADGREWERIRDPDLGGRGIQNLTAVSLIGDGFIAVGASDSSRTGIDAAVWLSEDGRNWERVADGLATEGNQAMAGIAAIPAGVIAVGTDESADRSQSDAAVWPSADGRVWERILDADLGGPDLQAAYGFAHSDSKGLVAVGSDVTTRGHEGVWASVHGRAWDHITAGFEDPGLSVMYSAAATAAGIVAVGREFHGDTDSGNAGVWKSIDGRRWEQVENEPSLEGPGEQVMWDVTTFLDGAVAVGGSGDRAAVWRLP